MNDCSAKRCLDWSIWSSLALKGSICCRERRRYNMFRWNSSSEKYLKKHRKGRLEGTNLSKPLFDSPIKSSLSITTGVTRHSYSGPTCGKNPANGRRFHSYFMNKFYSIISSQLSSGSHMIFRKRFWYLLWPPIGLQCNVIYTIIFGME